MGTTEDRFATAAALPSSCPSPSADTVGMNDVFVVDYQTQDGRRDFRQVLAGSLDDARQTHQEHHPGDQIVAVIAHG
jgi:hypothetical protein